MATALTLIEMQELQKHSLNKACLRYLLLTREALVTQVDKKLS